MPFTQAIMTTGIHVDGFFEHALVVTRRSVTNRNTDRPGSGTVVARQMPANHIVARSGARPVVERRYEPPSGWSTFAASNWV
jgi:hypothetical protein